VAVSGVAFAATSATFSPALPTGPFAVVLLARDLDPRVELLPREFVVRRREFCPPELFRLALPDRFAPVDLLALVLLRVVLDRVV
jgi:hypothetical protein